MLTLQKFWAFQSIFLAPITIAFSVANIFPQYCIRKFFHPTTVPTPLALDGCVGIGVLAAAYNMTTWNARMVSDIKERRRFALQGMLVHFAWLLYFVPIIFPHRWTARVENAWILNFLLGLVNYYYAFLAPAHIVAKPVTA